MFRTSALSLALRAVTLGSKFILLLFMARRLSPEEVGVFGLVSATIALALYVLGMDFYVFNTREVLACSGVERAKRIRDQLVFHGVIYLVLLPMLLVVFAGGVIEWRYLGWFYLLLVTEHLGQEASRLLVTLSRPILANLVLFLRTGIWVYGVVGLALWSDGFRLSWVWAGWAAGGLAALAFSAWGLRDLDWSGARRVPVDWGWMREGLGDGCRFLVATIALKAMEFAGRFFLQHYHGEAMVGVYTFYANIVNVVQTFVFAGIVALVFPGIISAWQQGRRKEYRALMRKMLLLSCGGTILLSAGVGLGISPILTLVGKAVYSEHLDAFWVMLGGIVVLIGAMTPHYGLYARHRDRLLVASSVAALVVALVLNVALVPRFGALGAALGTLGGYLVMALLKTFMLFVLEKKERGKEVVNEAGV